MPKENKTDEKYLDYFEMICPEDQEDVLTILTAATQELFNKFGIDFTDPKLLGVTWQRIFYTIVHKLEDYKTKYSNYAINFCDRLVIGYDTKEDEDDEKQGNFMIYIQHLNSNKKDDEKMESTDTAVERSVQWNTENVKSCSKEIKDISSAALLSLKDIDVTIGSSEPIMPIFIKTYEALVKYISIKRGETKSYEYEINFLSCFYIEAIETDDGIDAISVRPSIDNKLLLKDDLKASSKNE